MLHIPKVLNTGILSEYPQTIVMLIVLKNRKLVIWTWVLSNLDWLNKEKVEV